MPWNHMEVMPVVSRQKTRMSDEAYRKPKTQVFIGGDRQKGPGLETPPRFEELRLLREQMPPSGAQAVPIHIPSRWTALFIHCRSVFDNDHITIFGAPSVAPVEKKGRSREGPFELLFLYDPIVCLDGSFEEVTCGESRRDVFEAGV